MKKTNHTLMKEVERMIKVQNYQDEMLKEIYGTLEDNGINILGHLWAQEYVLEIQVFRQDFQEALEIMRMETPTECSCSFGVGSESTLVFQFDGI